MIHSLFLSIEAYLDADKWITNPLAMWSSADSRVPQSFDIANAICYHTNYRNSTEKDFNWRATVRWVPLNRRTQAVGASENPTYAGVDATQERKMNGQGAVVEFEWVPDLSDPYYESAEKKNENPMISIFARQDSFTNPLGRLGIRYLDSESSVDFSWDSIDPEIQKSRTFYPRLTEEEVLRCVKKVGSLIDVCGFEPSESRIGDIADEKEISEAIVMIPFVDNPIRSRTVASTVEVMGRNFFKVSKKLFSITKRNIEAGKPAIPVGTAYPVEEDIVETSVSDMIKKMQRYNLPPALDFIRYPLKSGEYPFVMYIFEFTEVLDKNDLSDIWQGLMPKCAKTATKETQIVEHELNAVNFFEGKKIPEDIRWMTFRVKRRANTNYYKVTADSKDDDRFNFEFEFGLKQPEYSYNWPYDYFSLIESARVRGGVSILPPPKSLKRPEDTEDRKIRSDRRLDVVETHASIETDKGVRTSASELAPWATIESDGGDE